MEMGMITRQPNGLYGRISTVVDAPTHTNMSEEDLLIFLQETEQLDHKEQSSTEWFERYGYDFQEACSHISDLNMSTDERAVWLEETSVLGRQKSQNGSVDIGRFQ